MCVMIVAIVIYVEQFLQRRYVLMIYGSSRRSTMCSERCTRMLVCACVDRKDSILQRLLYSPEPQQPTSTRLTKQDNDKGLNANTGAGVHGATQGARS